MSRTVKMFLAACMFGVVPADAPPVEASGQDKAARVALYVGPHCGMWRGVAGCLREQGIPYDKLTDKDIEAGKLSGYPVGVFPGGGGVKLSDRGLKNLKGFIRSGGGFVGICASAAFAQRQKILDLSRISVRGIGHYYICLREDHPVTQGYVLHRKAPKGSKTLDRVRIRRINGEFLVPGKGVKMIASYDSQATLGAIVAGRYGDGEVVLFSPHPELKVDDPPGWEWKNWQEPAKLLVNAVTFASKGAVKGAGK